MRVEPSQLSEVIDTSSMMKYLGGVDALACSCAEIDDEEIGGECSS